MHRSYHISKILFAVSLCLLGIFLLVWLRSVYLDKEEELNTKIDFHWTNMMQSTNINNLTVFLEYSLHKMKKKDALGNSKLKLTVSDSIINQSGTQIKRLELLSTEDSIIEESEHSTPFDLTFRSKNLSPLQVLDSMKQFYEIDLNTDNSKRLAYFNFVDTSKALQVQKEELAQIYKIDPKEVENKLRVIFHEKQLPLRFSVVQIDYDTSAVLNPNRVHEQKMNKEKFFLQIESYGGYVWKKMWFEVLMAILLMTAISLASYYILYNLRKQQQLMQLKNDLISNITHELRTPIFTVSAALEALENFNAMDDPERSKEYLQISKAELKRLSILVEKVLKTSMFDEPVSELKLETFDLVQLIQGIQSSMQLLFEQKQAKFYFQAPSPSITITADKIHLTNVIYNLIDNALKYNDQKPEIKLQLVENSSEIQLELEDNGIGIEKEYQEKVFDRFFRVPTGNQHNVKGYGLGLNYVAGVVQKHGGTITVKSKSGEGSTFIIQLPKSK